MSRERKLKVLISAYACEPDKGSEPGVGWNWAKQIARFHEAWVITRANNKESIDKELQQNPDPNLHFLYYDLPYWLSFWKKKERGLYLYYLLWQIGSYLTAKNIHKAKHFDLVHYITFGNFWLPTFMHFLPVPFVLGPVGGGDRIPRAFRRTYPIKARVQEMIRDIMLACLKVNPLFLYICRKASVIMVRTEGTFNHIPLSCRHKVVKMIETGIDAKVIPLKKNQTSEDFVQIVSVGRLIYLKGFDLALKAFARSMKQYGQAKLVIIGDGPEKDRLLRICQEENISDAVLFTGRIDREKVLEYMSRSSIFLFLSLKEGGPWVLFEAMLLGLPIICMDTGGMAEIVTDDGGVKVHPLSPEQTIEDVADAISRLGKNPELRIRMGAAGRKRIEEAYFWDTKGELIRTLYANCFESE